MQFAMLATLAALAVLATVLLAGLRYLQAPATWVIAGAPAPASRGALGYNSHAASFPTSRRHPTP
jgi:hypothetical protein